jgi:hypothetical protein
MYRLDREMTGYPGAADVPQRIPLTNGLLKLLDNIEWICHDNFLC